MSNRCFSPVYRRFYLIFWLQLQVLEPRFNTMQVTRGLFKLMALNRFINFLNSNQKALRSFKMGKLTWKMFECLLCCLYMYIYKGTCSTFSRHKDTILTTGIFFTKGGIKGNIDCLRICIRSSYCVAYNIRAGNGLKVSIEIHQLHFCFYYLLTLFTNH